MATLVERKQQLVGEYKQHEKDTGSPEVQIALLTERITELTEHLYDENSDCDSNVIEVFVGRLRRKLDPDGSLHPITTRRGRGYSLDLEPLPPAGAG